VEGLSEEQQIMMDASAVDPLERMACQFAEGLLETSLVLVMAHALETLVRQRMRVS